MSEMTTERLRELAAGATLYGHERNAIAAELLAKREECEALQRERDDWKASSKLMEHKVITCGVAATNPDAELTRRGAYGEKWNSPQAEAVRVLRAERDAARAERDRYHDALVARHGGEPLALLSELDAARAERDAAISQASSLTGRLDGALEVQRKLRAERDAVKRQRDELLAAVLPVLEKIEPKPSPFQPLLMALVAAVKAAEQPKPEVQPPEGGA